LYYVNAGSVLRTIENRFKEYGFPLIEDRDIIPNDETTLFVCSGMQQLKSKFLNPDFTKYGSVQSCIRTNDLDLIGDGTHLTYFEMVGNFSFGNNDYAESCEMWHKIIQDLGIDVDSIHVHPSQDQHKSIWRNLNYIVVDDPECAWSDGNIGGYCCEMYVGDLELGNLVNTLGNSVDVGFGLERLIQVIEGCSRVDESSLFDQNLSFKARDHLRSLNHLYGCGIPPGDKGRNGVVRKILRTFISESGSMKYPFKEWLQLEERARSRQIGNALRAWRRHKNKPVDWWLTNIGVHPDVIRQMKIDNR
jgi:alanyl-tRNA synthetase